MKTPILALATAIAASSGLLTLPDPAAPLQEQPPAEALEPDAARPSSEALEELLVGQGFHRVELSRMSTSHFLLHVSINGSEPRRFVCDTGAGVSTLFPSYAAELGLEPIDTGETASGVGGGGLAISRVAIDSLQIGDATFSDRELALIDLSYLNQQFVAAGEEPVAGIIGAPWLIEHEAVIDIPAGALYAKE